MSKPPDRHSMHNPRSSGVFCSLSRDDNTRLPKKALDLIIARDSFFTNSNAVPHDKVLEYLTSVVSRCSTDDHGRAIAGALLTLTYSPITESFVSCIFQQCDKFYEAIFVPLCEVVRKYFEIFIQESAEATFKLFECLCLNDRSGYRPALGTALISQYDAGCLSKLNLQLIQFFSKNVVTHGSIWVGMDTANTLLVIKFLRFYQDLFIFQDLPKDRYGKDLYLRAEHIGNKFMTEFVSFFEQSVPNLAKHGIREIIRILYDPRTYRRLQTKFPSIYRMVVAMKEDDPNAFLPTVPNIACTLLPYSKLCSLIEFDRTWQSDQSRGVKALLERPTPLIDVDLLLSDICRTYLQSSDYDRKPGEERYKTLEALFVFSRPKLYDGGKSFVNALINDWFYSRSQLFSDHAYCRKTVNLVLPATYFLRDRSHPEYGTLVAEAIWERLKDDDHLLFKRNSFRETAAMLRNYAKLELSGVFRSMQNLDASKVNGLEELIQRKEDDTIPAQLRNFRKSGVSIDSPQGLEMIKLVNNIVANELSKGYNTLDEMKCRVIMKAMDALVPKDQNELSVVLDRVEAVAAVLHCSKTIDDAKMFLQWCVANQDASAFVDFGYALKMSHFLDILNNWIVSGKEGWIWIIKKCEVFRSPSILRQICEYASWSTVIELAQIPYLPVDDRNGVYSRIFAECQLWSSDAQIKLTKFFTGRFLSQSDYLPLSHLFVKHFHHLPEFVKFFFEDEFMMTPCRCIMQIVDEIRQSNVVGAAAFCKNIRDVWATPGEAREMNLKSDEIIVL